MKLSSKIRCHRKNFSYKSVEKMWKLIQSVFRYRWSNMMRYKLLLFLIVSIWTRFVCSTLSVRQTVCVRGVSEWELVCFSRSHSGAKESLWSIIAFYGYINRMQWTTKAIIEFKYWLLDKNHKKQPNVKFSAKNRRLRFPKGFSKRKERFKLRI